MIVGLYDGKSTGLAPTIFLLHQVSAVYCQGESVYPPVDYPRSAQWVPKSIQVSVGYLVMAPLVISSKYCCCFSKYNSVLCCTTDVVNICLGNSRFSSGVCNFFSLQCHNVAGWTLRKAADV